MTRELLPADCLLYFKRDFVDRVISLKTWCKTAAHVEVYIGAGKSVASRNGIGVNAYPLRTDGLTHVLRPNQPFDLGAAMAWFSAKARGKPYGFLDLLNFCNIPVKSSGLICSQFAALFYDAGGLVAFQPGYDRGCVPPSFFLVSPVFDEIPIL